MRNLALFLLSVILLIGGCAQSSASYEQGKLMAEETYGSVAPQKMMNQMQPILQQVQLELKQAENKQEWWDGFCDRGEEIWLERIDQMNTAMGRDVFSTDQINVMFDQMRSSFRE